jgi:hypothetical protein
MLAIDNARELIESVWLGLGCQVQLPENWGDFFEHTGMTPTEYDDRRTYSRMHFRGKAVVRHSASFYAIYTKDVSRGGIGFYHAEQLLPAERCRIWLSNGLSHDIEIVRCRLRHRSCYECGAKFVAEQAS